ncbi:MgtC/SapB family protein [Enterococcus sp. AZ194]|uniref:MgtC/SapB family protein n=1 Tax=Enterococcus sp. AZ194 TaxID=2774629 RepID=UPI003F6865D3
MGIGGVIGYEREQKNRPAGIRTHILVCIGAAIVALIQVEIACHAIQMTIENPNLVGVVRSDEARLTAQVVSGVGFLGAGTIIVTKQRVLGLTTAASLWSSATVGIGIGMGYYRVSIVGFLFVMASLLLVNKIIKVPKLRSLEIQYIHRVETKEFINNYFEKHNIEIEDVTFEVQVIGTEKIYKNTYTIDLPRLLFYSDVIEEISMYSNVQKIRLISLAD